jgi:hypothetical protein
VPRCYKQGTKSVLRQFYTGICEDRTCTREAKKYPLIEAVARERLVKTTQAGRGLAGAVVISEMWRLAVALYQLVIPSGVYKVFNKSIHQTKSRV